MAQLIERTRFSVVLAAALLLALPGSALAGPGDALTQTTAGATDTAQQAATAIVEQGPTQRQTAEAAPKPPGEPTPPDTSGATETISQKAGSAADTATSAVGAATKETTEITREVRRSADSAGSAASPALSSATGTSDSLGNAASDGAGSTAAKLDQTIGGQASGSVREGAEQTIAGVGADDLPPPGGPAGGDLLPQALTGSTPAPPADGGGILPTLPGGPTGVPPAAGEVTLLESVARLPIVGPAAGGITPGGGGISPGGGGGFTPGSGGGVAPAGGGIPAGDETPTDAGTAAGGIGDVGGVGGRLASTARAFFSIFSTNGFLSSLGASFATLPPTGTGPGSPAPGIPGHGPAPFALPSLGGSFADGLVLAAGLLALMTIFFLTAPGLGRWIRTSAEKWPPPGLVSPIEVPG
jgi:translation initiation factor IF-2